MQDPLFFVLPVRFPRNQDPGHQPMAAPFDGRCGASRIALPGCLAGIIPQMSSMEGPAEQARPDDEMSCTQRDTGVFHEPDLHDVSGVIALDHRRPVGRETFQHHAASDRADSLDSRMRRCSDSLRSLDSREALHASPAPLAALGGRGTAIERARDTRALLDARRASRAKQIDASGSAHRVTGSSLQARSRRARLEVAMTDACREGRA
jgi:hypothetical protein